MKVAVYSYRAFDEGLYFEKIAKELGMELVLCPDAPDMENAALAEGCDYLSVITTKIDAALVERFHDLGVKMISTRTIGYDHIDLKKAKELGVKISNATYSPNSVADYALMLMLMTTRRMKMIMNKAAIQDFSLPGNIGKELPDMTVGIVGTGRIGETLIRHLSGFGCKILAYDLYEKDSVKQFATYVPLDTLYRESDIISLHIPASEKDYHMISGEVMDTMKDGVILINTARGSLIDSRALIDHIESGKIGAAGLDVVENEFGMYYYDKKTDVMDNRELAILKSFHNVVVTPHMAFYTNEAIRDMVYSSLKSYRLEADGEKNPWLIQ